MECLEPALECARSQDAVGRHRLSKTFGRNSTKIDILEQVADEPMRGGVDHDAIGLGQSLQPGG